MQLTGHYMAWAARVGGRQDLTPPTRIWECRSVTAGKELPQYHTRYAYTVDCRWFMVLELGTLRTPVASSSARQSKAPNLARASHRVQLSVMNCWLLLAFPCGLWLSSYTICTPQLHGFFPVRSSSYTFSSPSVSIRTCHLRHPRPPWQAWNTPCTAALALTYTLFALVVYLNLFKLLLPKVVRERSTSTFRHSRQTINLDLTPAWPFSASTKRNGCSQDDSPGRHWCRAQAW